MMFWFEKGGDTVSCIYSIVEWIQMMHKSQLSPKDMDLECSCLIFVSLIIRVKVDLHLVVVYYALTNILP